MALEAEVERVCGRQSKRAAMKDAGFGVILSRGDSAMKNDVTWLLESVEHHRLNEAKLSNDFIRLRTEQHTS